MSFLLPFLIGFLTGLRSLTPPAVVAWAAHLGWLTLPGTLALMGSLPAVAIFTVLALGELAADKWPKVPSRTSLPGLSARVLMAALAGACITAAAGQGVNLGIVLGAAGGVAGAFAGYHARVRLVQALKVPDYTIALLEDFIAVAGCVAIVYL